MIAGESMTVKRVVTPDDLDHLPTPVHKIVAKQLILTGEWALKSISGNETRTEGHMG
jgi:hypothetical protein